MKQLLYFSAEWCGPCKMMTPVIQDLSSNYNISVSKFDTEVDVDIATKYNVRAIPTFVLIDNGVELKRIVGAQTKQTMVNFIK